MNKTYWLITYLPAVVKSTEVGWVYFGTKEDLDRYLFEKHSCKCPGCAAEDDWWNTAEACEYDVRELDIQKFWDFVEL